MLKVRASGAAAVQIDPVLRLGRRDSTFRPRTKARSRRKAAMRYQL
jgi:hypothetical protein